MDKEVEISGKKYTIKRLKYMDTIGQGVTPGDIKAATKTLFKLSAGLTDEEIDALELGDGIKLQKIISEVNELSVEDFQEPTEEKTN